MTTRTKVVRVRAIHRVLPGAVKSLTSTFLILPTFGSLLAFLACSPQTELAPQWRTQRSVDSEDSPQPLDEMRLSHSETVERWVFSDTGEHEKWTLKIEQATEETKADTTNMTLMTDRVGIDAAGVDQVTMSFEGDRKIVPFFQWAAPGQDFAKNRRIAGRSVGNPKGRLRDFVFPVTESPNWHGSVQRVQIELRARQPDRTVVREIRFLRHEYDLVKVGEATRHAWRITRMSEQRIGRPGVPGFPIPVSVGRSKTEQQLRFRVAVGDNARDGATFRVSDRRSGKVLFERNVQPHETGWSGEVAVDIPPSPRADTEIELITLVPGLERPAEGLPSWGSLRIVGRDDREPPLNVVFICVDTLRADHLVPYGYHRVTSPEIDRWAERHGVVFSTAVAPAPWTLPSHIAFLSGLDALHHGSNYDRPAPDGMTFLAEYLHQKGYLTSAITGGVYLNPKFGLDQGFDEYQSWTGPKREEIAAHGPLAVRWIESNDVEPFFFFFHTYEVHGPFLEHEPHYSTFAEPGESPDSKLSIGTRALPGRAEDGFVVRSEFVRRESDVQDWETLEAGREREVVDRYDAGIASADAHIGALLNAIYSSDFADRTIVILTSDHGEALGERGLAGHAYLDDFNLLVPLIVAAPTDGWSPGRIDQQVRLIDIVPTILDLVGIETPAELDGESLHPLVIARGGPAQLDRPGREAWSYAASSNFGISLRDAGSGLRYEFNNAAWVGVQGHETIERIRVGDAAQGTAPSEIPKAAIQRLRDKVRLRAESTTPGTWIRVSSNADSAFVIKIESPILVRPHLLKCMVCPTGLTWIRRGVVSIKVNPGEEYLLHGEIDASTTLALSVEPGVRTPGIAIDVDLTGVEESVELILDRRGWHELGEVSDPAQTRATISVWSRGGPSRDAANSPLDRDLAEQLRALGYVVE